MENLARFIFNCSKAVVVRNVNSITKPKNAAHDPIIEILYTSGEKETVYYGTTELATRDRDFNNFHNVPMN